MSTNQTATISETEALKAQIEALLAKQKELKKAIADGRHQLSDKLSVSVSEKSGAVSVYGFGRFPVSLYKDQWEMLVPVIGALVKFINDNAEEIKRLEVAAEARKAVEARK